MNVLVTGGAGFIGSHLVEALVNESHNVKVIDDLSSGKNENILKKLGVELLKKDISVYSEIKDAFEGVDVVFHLAAMNRAMTTIEDPLRSNAVNVTGTLNVLEASRNSGVNKVIYISSSSVYGKNPSFPRREDLAPLLPAHPYGVGKLTGEQYTRIYHELYGLKTVILRYFSVYGPRQRWDLRHSAVIPKFVHNILNDLPVTVYGTGEQRRAFTYVKDAVEATMLASKKERAVGKIINIATEEETSINNIIKYIAEYTRKDPVIKHAPPLPGDIMQNKADITLAKRILEYSPRYDIRTGLRLLIDEVLHND